MAINATTIRLSITRGQLHIARARAWLAQRDPLLLFAGPLALVLLGLMTGAQLLRFARPAVDAHPTTPRPIIIVATALAQPRPTPAAAVQGVAPQAPRYVVGFDRPNGTALGAIVAPEANAIVARWGDDWLQTTHDGAPIWIRAADLGMTLSNVAPMPQTQPQFVYVAASQPAAAPVVDAAATPVAPPAPTEAPPVEPAISERQANIQGHYVQPTYPTLAPMEQNATTQEWARQQYRSEHP